MTTISKWWHGSPACANRRAAAASSSFSFPFPFHLRSEMKCPSPFFPLLPSFSGVEDVTGGNDSGRLGGGDGYESGKGDRALVDGERSERGEFGGKGETVRGRVIDATPASRDWRKYCGWGVFGDCCVLGGGGVDLGGGRGAGPRARALRWSSKTLASRTVSMQ